jgi:hypothetical protein
MKTLWSACGIPFPPAPYVCLSDQSIPLSQSGKPAGTSSTERTANRSASALQRRLPAALFESEIKLSGAFCNSSANHPHADCTVLPAFVLPFVLCAVEIMG